MGIWFTICFNKRFPNTVIYGSRYDPISHNKHVIVVWALPPKTFYLINYNDCNHNYYYHCFLNRLEIVYVFLETKEEKERNKKNSIETVY